MGSPSPTPTYAISLPRTRRRFLWYGNAAEIMWPSPSFSFLCSSRTSSARYATLWPSLVLLLLCRVTARTRQDSEPKGLLMVGLSVLLDTGGRYGVARPTAQAGDATDQLLTSICLHVRRS